MKQLIFENEHGRVYETFPGTYEVHQRFTRDMDGINEEGLYFYKSFRKHDTYDWLGRMNIITWDYDPKQAAIDCLR